MAGGSADAMEHESRMTARTETKVDCKALGLRVLLDVDGLAGLVTIHTPKIFCQAIM